MTDTYNQVLEDLNTFCMEILARYNYIDYDGVNAIKGEVISLLNRQKAVTEQEVEHTHMRLPVDAEGVPIRLGDTLVIERSGSTDIGEVSDIHLQEGKCAVSICFEYDSAITAFPEDYRHYSQPDTVESVLADFANCVLNNGHQWGLVSETTTADYAERIRRACNE